MPQNVEFTTLDNFIDSLVGLYCNKNQAYTRPTEFAFIYVLWEDLGDYKLHSKSWYKYKGIDDPYRESYHKVLQQNDNIIVETYDMDWTKRDGCAILFKSVHDGWVGQNNGTCIVRDAVLKSQVHLTKKLLKTWDAGYKDGKIVWGGTKFYEFGRITQR